MAADEAPPDVIKVPMVWSGLDELPILAANQILTQIDEDNVYLTVGVATPPPLLGTTPAELRSQAEQIQFVQARPLVRVAVSRRSLGEIIEVLQRTASNFDKQGDEK